MFNLRSIKLVRIISWVEYRCYFDISLDSYQPMNEKGEPMANIIFLKKVLQLTDRDNDVNRVSQLYIFKFKNTFKIQVFTGKLLGLLNEIRQLGKLDRKNPTTAHNTGN